MTTFYTYTIETSDYDGVWTLVERGTERSANTPHEYARALLESWVVGHPHRLYGGERIEVFGPEEIAPADGTVHVRVGVYHCTEDEHDVDPAAVAYLQYHEPEPIEDLTFGRAQPEPL